MAPTFVQSAFSSFLLLSSFTFSNARSLDKRVAVPSSLPGTWTSQGCYTDSVAARTLTGATYTDTTKMTDESCISFCSGKGFNYAGTEYSQECYCGNVISASGAPAAAGDCNMGCTGNTAEACGGPQRLNLFYNGQPAPAGPQTNPGPGIWTSLGCYTDNTGARTLLTGMAVTGGAASMTVALCTSACQAANYVLAGVEYAGECYCGNVFSNGGGPAPDGSSGCNMPCNGNSSEFCGGSFRLNVYSSTSTTKTSTTQTSTSASATSTGAAPTGWSALGCYTDSVNARSLGTGMAVPGGPGAMTIELCQAACQAAGFTLAGVEYADECYCDNTLRNGGGPAPDGNALCNMACSGNAQEMCGGPNRLDLYRLGGATQTSTSSSATSTGAAPTGWSALGCYTDSVNARSLGTGMAVPGGPGAMTVELCQAACQAAGFTLAGVEYADECYCDNSLRNGGGPAPDGNALCNMACKGNSQEMCGGPNRLDLYSFGTPPTGWSVLGCYTDSVNARSLGTGMAVPGGPGAMTIELCQAACQAAGFTLAGVEYADECYCDNALRNGGGPAPDGNALCNMACSGNAKETCGGPNRLDLYSFASSTSTSTSTSTTSSTTATGTGSATSLPSGWAYKGCWVDNTYGRILGTEEPDNASLTIESCVQTCAGLGFTVAGVEYSKQCFCDHTIIEGGTLATSETQCNMACSGNSAETCGGPNRMNIYAIGNLTVLPPPTVQKTGLPGSWKYMGCLSDLENNAPRTFPRSIYLPNNNSATNCLTMCSDFGYGYGGMEYGNECYCGDASDITAAGATLKPEADCSFPCSGNATTLCGGALRISYYAWTGTPLNTWHYPTGNNAGEYQFLIGGLITPLLTIPGVNGKVTFLEKWGTGPPNSTGAYELDLNEINDFTAAWRPMHVKTDVFCSASLVLPDKVGRQINIGGWSGDSTYGVRIYWPDGSPGVPGVNDWQENYKEVSLQAGRWYPSAMVMANGSILVVGGEGGSNGAPVPSLEVLPKPPGGKIITCDFLLRTDPLNLYPFLAVLPSGGILIVYYNEARILDPSTFATIKTLPNIPSSVDNSLGGRTYPLEGTAVLMPQHAPYSDPLTVLVCGGSTPGAGVAIDNCVSIQPDAPNPTWTLERMPSKRVMTCIAALPDGTYLILNGAKQGVAGFGLATDPNLNAILYDPSQPVNSRFSVMANTTVDRLYHSEAVLLQDGRVLVSGSDPEDTRFPQEYRVEVFVPPYLLSGLQKPTFSIQNKDWSYGQSVQITVSLPSGATSNMKVSLLGAVASTHGNSMGQRTIFPAVSCSGNTCTITAPPNANTCPPGWFQLFVLDGPTPSNSTWVRIGGDPAALGNWPQFPDFTIPGV